MSDYDHSAIRKARLMAEEQYLDQQRLERARKLTESIADHDTTPTQHFRNAKRLRNRSADAMKDQGIE